MNKQIKALVIPADGPARVEQIEDTLDAFQAIVGGLIEGTPVLGADLDVMYVNEEGIMLGLEINPKAAMMSPHYARLLGPAFVVGGTPDGEAADVSDTCLRNAQIMGLLP